MGHPKAKKSWSYRNNYLWIINRLCEMELADMTYFAVKTVPLMIYSIPSWVMERISSSAGIRCSIRRAVMFCMWLCWVHVRRWCLPIWVLRVFEIRLCSFGCVFKCKVLPEFLPGYLQTAAYMDNPPHPTQPQPTPLPDPHAFLSLQCLTTIGRREETVDLLPVRIGNIQHNGTGRAWQL